ncbi:MAG TPA: TCR/Tet family MFS transporter [Candidatus Baltobacteraceae bacterium]|nr:TCR/Tet family MFS transporter [Candidatus Baltobacteraceae bacterium]
MKSRQAGLAFILITVSIDMVAFGIVAPVLPKLVLNFLGGHTADAAKWFGLFGTVFALMQLFCSPMLGMLSDRFGRRPVIILSNVGTSLDFIIMALSPTIWWLFAGRVIAGITTSSVTTAYAYITDVTTREKRAAAMGMVGAAFGVGFIVGPAIGGILGNIDPRLPFWVCAGLSMANALYGFFVLPESLKPDHRQTRFAWERANPFGALKLLRSHPELSKLAFINFIEYVAHEVLPVVFTLYVMYRYAWNLAQVGWSLAVVGLSIAIVQSVVMRPAVAWLGERRALITGLSFGTFAFALVGYASSGVIMIAAIVVTAFWGLAGPPAQSLMTHRVSAREQGELQGALGSMRSIAMLVGPGLFSMLFAYSIDKSHTWQVPGAAWYFAAFLLAITVVLAVNVGDAHEAAERGAVGQQETPNPAA